MICFQIATLLLLASYGAALPNYNTRMRGKAYKRQLLQMYPHLMSLADDGDIGKKSGGSGGNCNSGDGNVKGCGTGNHNPLSKGDPKQKASSIAQKAALEAKAANDAQTSAAEAAASQVKLELAEKAVQAARAAEAALAGKQQIMEQLQAEEHEAEAVVQEVNTSLQNTQSNAVGANSAAAEAQNQLTELKHLIEAATTNLASIENVANGAQQELAEKTQLLEAAKNRVEGLTRQLIAARQDFEKTKQAAYKAACAAVEAKQKATRSRRMSKGIHTYKSAHQHNYNEGMNWRFR